MLLENFMARTSIKFRLLPGAAHTPVEDSVEKCDREGCNSSVRPIEEAGGLGGRDGTTRDNPMAQDDSFVPGNALHGIEVLYVDDEPQRRDVMRKILMNLHPRRVQVAESSAEALKVVMGTPCNIVVAEHRLKAMDGIALVRELRAATNYPRAIIPVLLLGDPVGTDIIKAALGAGANHFLIRPVTPEKLYDRIHGVLNDNRPFVVKDGRYVIKPSKMTLPEGATKSDLTAQP
jgi:CheY-like chemotaxis protein